MSRSIEIIRVSQRRHVERSARRAVASMSDEVKQPREKTRNENEQAKQKGEEEEDDDNNNSDEEGAEFLRRYAMAPDVFKNFTWPHQRASIQKKLNQREKAGHEGVYKIG